MGKRQTKVNQKQSKIRKQNNKNRLNNIHKNKRDKKPTSHRNRPLLRQKDHNILPKNRKIKIRFLWGYLKKEYTRVVNQIENLEITPEEEEIIIAIYSGATTDQITQIIDIESNQIQIHIQNLKNKEILKENKNGLKLISKGKIATNLYIDDINN
ncbi:MAG: Chemotaxis system protein containing CheF-like and HTH domain, archaellum-associated [Candidatus Methanohalarchaeum thermophilum]|uniref:Chemotaxis system protein containing CheF-like and HTH domain, archaellum-associated n=1 Tax=Methanohalarchaeum thermophilum TaxID=1903181 RepID=A0A1Q6DT55_METT1|nr:MAG: Chemotaxis system protein containing CheF-like and HTH domain, archaellum-associated [Candidatus Methanohalarchaeum thermophilum]